ncbi:MAG TPA: phosphotransferase [Acidimicrobiales bacterium]|nr:phosphotransferase [Acidimicrobiales bacterium]
MTAAIVTDILDALGVRPDRVLTLKDVQSGNSSWLVETHGGALVVLRRYHDQATRDELGYEHAVLRHLSQLGWLVPVPESDLLRQDRRWFCLTRFVPGDAVTNCSVEQQRQRGRALAQLHLALRGLHLRIGQRHRWQPQHRGVTVHTNIEWEACLRNLSQADPRLAAWAEKAAIDTHAALAAIGAHELPVDVVHGDFAEWNVHYQHGKLVGVIDFGLTHADSRPYELAIARTYRAPETISAYRDELTLHGWPLTPVEEAAIEPLHRAFRVDMAAWQVHHGQRTGSYDLAMIERQLARTGTSPP